MTGSPFTFLIVSKQHKLTHISRKMDIFFGVPQVLAALLFLIYINDIRKCSDIFDFHLFADGSSLLYADKGLTSLEPVNNELKNVAYWLNADKLTQYTKRSNLVIFRPYRRNSNENIHLKMFDNSTDSLNFLVCKDYH